MRTYILKRLLLVIPTLFVITVISYGMMRLAPGDPVKAMMISSGGASTGEGEVGVRKEGESDAAKAFKRRFHLDKPWYVGYWYWLAGDNRAPTDPDKGYGVLRGDFGISITVSLGTPVWKLIAERLPVTIKLNLWAIVLIYLVAIPAGLYSAVFRNTLSDRAMSVVFFILYSLPSFWVGLMMILMVSKYLPGWPTSGLEGNLPHDAPYATILLDTATHYVLPVLCLSYGAFAGLSRYARVGMLEVIRQDYIRTARAKGLSEWTVILKHAFRNALIPLVVLFAGLLPGLIGGSVIVEFLFNIEGMGDLGLRALGGRDYPVLMTLFGFSAVLTLAGILVSDILLAMVDPRISYD